MAKKKVKTRLIIIGSLLAGLLLIVILSLEFLKVYRIPLLWKIFAAGIVIGWNSISLALLLRE